MDTDTSSTDTSSTDTAAGKPTAQVSKAILRSREKRLGLMLRTVCLRILARMTKKYTIEMVLESMVATAAPDTSMPKPKGMVRAPLNSVSPLFEDKDGVQDDVHNAAKGKADARLFGFAHSPHQMAQDQPGHCGQTADDKHLKEIPGRKTEGQFIGLEKGEDGFHEQPQDNGQNGRHAKAGPEAKGRGFLAVS